MIRSLRAQIVFLAVGSTIGAMLVVGLGTQRMVRREFEATLTAQGGQPIREVPTTELTTLLQSQGWDGLRAWVAARARGGDRFLAIDPSGRVMAAPDSAIPAWSARPAPDSGWVLESRHAGELTRFVLSGGVPLLSARGDTAALAFALPPEDDAVAADTSEGGAWRAFGRRLWLMIAMVVVLATTVAVALSARVARPLQRLAAAARMVGSGNFTARVEEGRTVELAEVTKAFNAMAGALERSEAQRHRMARDVAHELRTPLTNLRGQIESMQDGLRPADEAGLRSLLEEATLLERLVRDLGQLADADAGRLEVDPSVTALEPEIRRTVEAFVQAGRAPGGRVAWAVPADLCVHADARRVGQVLRNLIDNALVHAPGSSVRIAAGPDIEGAGMIRVTVDDDGPGLDPSHLPFVFERLYRADPSRGRETGGRGLGLAIVRELVEAQGGQVGIESAQGEGARLWFTLPGVPGDQRTRGGGGAP